MNKRRVIVGVCGGIAAFKSAALVSSLIQNGHDVWVVLTDNAKNFVGPATFAALCSRQPVTSTFDPRFPLGPHIELPEAADLLIIAPATARIIASCANGLADDLLATLYLHCECPVLMAPAMSTPMWEKPSIQRNIQQLVSDGVRFVGPESGWLSCRRQGLGRMSEPQTLLVEAEKVLAAKS